MVEHQFLVADSNGVLMAEIDADSPPSLRVRTISRFGATDLRYDVTQAAQLADGFAGLIEQMKAGVPS